MTRIKKRCDNCSKMRNEVHYYKGKALCHHCFSRELHILEYGLWVNDYEKRVKTGEVLIPYKKQSNISLSKEYIDKLDKKRPLSIYLADLILKDIKSKSKAKSNVKNKNSEGYLVSINLFVALTPAEYKKVINRQKILFGNGDRQFTKYIKHLIIEDLKNG